jgi:hypothetical protein
MIHIMGDNYQPDPQPDVQPGTTPSAFRVLCPGCGTPIPIPYDPIAGAMLDQCLYLEELLRDLLCAREEVRL